MKNGCGRQTKGRGELVQVMKQKKNSGSTMVEVLVGFTLLMILMVGLTRIIHISSEMVFNTKDMLNDQKTLVEEFYKEDHGKLNTDISYSDDFKLVETDSTGNNVKTDGVTISLEKTKIEKVSDDESGLTIYQISRESATP